MHCVVDTLKGALAPLPVFLIKLFILSLKWSVMDGSTRAGDSYYPIFNSTVKADIPISMHVFYVPIIPIGARPMATRLFGYSAGKYRYTNAQQQSGD